MHVPQLEKRAMHLPSIRQWVTTAHQQPSGICHPLIAFASHYPERDMEKLCVDFMSWASKDTVKRYTSTREYGQESYQKADSRTLHDVISMRPLNDREIRIEAGLTDKELIHSSDILEKHPFADWFNVCDHRFVRYLLMPILETVAALDPPVWVSPSMVVTGPHRAQYRTPAHERWVRMHYDDADSIVVLLKGHKTWRCVPHDAIKWDQERGKENEALDVDAATYPHLEWSEADMAPGDIFLMKRGTGHMVMTDAATSSVSLNIFVYNIDHQRDASASSSHGSMAAAHLRSQEGAQGS